MDQKECPIVSDWQEMKAEFREAVAAVETVRLTVSETNGLVRSVLDRLQHLEKLDALETIADLLGKAVRWLLGVILVALLIIGGLFAVVILRDAAKNLHVTSGSGAGFHLETPPGVEKKTVEHEGEPTGR